MDRSDHIALAVTALPAAVVLVAGLALDVSLLPIAAAEVLAAGVALPVLLSLDRSSGPRRPRTR